LVSGRSSLVAIFEGVWMQAIGFEQHGQLEQIRLLDLPQPTPGPGEVLLTIKAAALNRLDLWVLEGWPGLRLKLPHIMGCDGAGVVTAVAPDVTDFAVGDRVAVNPTASCDVCPFCRSGRDHMCDQFAIFGEHLPGFYAEFQAVPARNLLKLPDGFPFEKAAASSLVYVTAWHSLIERGRFQAGEDILIVGAGGGVNGASIQIARLAGARTIYAVGSTDEKLAQARRLGADVTINRRDEDWGRAIYRLTNKQGVDVVVDNVGADSYMRSLRALKKGGRLLTVGNSSGPTFELDNRYLFARHLEIIGGSMGPRASYEKVMGLVFDGRLQPMIDAVYPLSEGLVALRRLAAGDVTGKLVIAPS
jgi:NADPH:quinone reductase-like Zn-dependent oxidoreductase